MKNLGQSSRTKFYFSRTKYIMFYINENFGQTPNSQNLIMKYQKHEVMPTTIDLLSLIEEERTLDIKHLAKNLGIEVVQLEKILEDLAVHSLIEYDQRTGKIKMPTWLTKINMENKSIKPATGTIILPKNQEIKLQDIAIGNFSDKNLELNVRLTGKQKEVSICNMRAH